MEWGQEGCSPASQDEVIELVSVRYVVHSRNTLFSKSPRAQPPESWAIVWHSGEKSRLRAGREPGFQLIQSSPVLSHVQVLGTAQLVGLHTLERVSREGQLLKVRLFQICPGILLGSHEPTGPHFQGHAGGAGLNVCPQPGHRLSLRSAGQMLQ